MLRTICKGKIHRATVTEARLDYVGSITIDRALMDAANLKPYEMVQVTNVANATLWRTYAIPAPAGSGTVCLNGPPARLFQPTDLVIVLSLADVTDEEYEQITAHIVHVDEKNQITKVESHVLKDL
ncbi:MAG: aspartate 1-decarboxylase [Firmicutes bacterium]|nr:aspartate 1-decarboxylase [Bacillota bacterium]